MLRIKSRTIAPALAMVLMAGMSWTGPARAGTDLSNVAWKQPVTPNAFGGSWYGRVFAENADGYVVVDGDAAMALINDDLSGYNNYAYPRSDGGGGWIDLGAEYNIASIEVIPRTTGYWSQLELATVYGSAKKTTAADYSFIIPDKSSADLSHVQTTDRWRGVRWIRIVDESDVYMGVGDTNFMLIGDIRVVASVATSGSFIGGVGATATSTYNAPLTYSPNFLVSHQGMTDQHGPVGNTAAKSNANIGLWINNNLGAGGFVDQAVTFDLGGDYDLDQIRIWNFNQSTWSTSTMAYVDSTNRGVNAALIEYSQDGGDTYIALNDTNGTAPGNYTIPKAQTNSNGSPIQNSSQLAATLTDLIADHVRITVKSNYGDATYAGLSEVRFYGAAIIPVIPGDTNHDGKVNATDATALCNYWGATVTEGDVSKGDFNNDGKVNAADASILAANWGYGDEQSNESSAVPEPGMILMLLVAASMLLVRRESRERS